MNIHALAAMDWREGIPAIEGSVPENDLGNLKNILDKIKDSTDDDNDSKIVLRKCIDYTKNLKDAKDYYLASRIFANNFKVESETIVFKNGSEKISKYQIKALEKDFPGKDIRKIIKNLSKEDFQAMLDFLYAPEGKPKNKEATKIVVDFLKENNLYSATRVQKSFGLKPDTAENLSRMSSDDILYFLSGEVDIDDYEMLDILKEAERIVSLLDPNKREDFKLAVKLNQALNKLNPKEESVKTRVKELKTTTGENIRGASLGANEKLSLFERIVSSLASFIGKSVDNWLSIDEEFVTNSLQEATDLRIEVPENSGEKFWTFLEKNKDSIQTIILTQEEYNKNETKVPFGVNIELK